MNIFRILKLYWLQIWRDRMEHEWVIYRMQDRREAEREYKRIQKKRKTIIVNKMRNKPSIY